MAHGIPVVILCGGYGTRLSMENHARPKALVEIGDKPIIWHVMRIYARHGYNRFIFCLGYQGFQIKQYFLNYRYMVSDFTVTSATQAVHFDREVHEDWSITFAETGLDTNTGGRIHRIQKYIDTDYFLATYADGVANVNITKLVNFHLDHEKVATMTGVRPLSNFGILSFDERGEPVGFREKPLQEDWINGGFFVFDRKIFDYLQPDSVLEQEPLARLAADRELAVYEHRGFWKCMDTFKDAWTLNEILRKSDRPPWEVEQQESDYPATRTRSAASTK